MVPSLGKRTGRGRTSKVEEEEEEEVEFRKQVEPSLRKKRGKSFEGKGGCLSLEFADGVCEIAINPALLPAPQALLRHSSLRPSGLIFRPLFIVFLPPTNHRGLQGVPSSSANRHHSHLYLTQSARHLLSIFASLFSDCLRTSCCRTIKPFSRGARH
jgi:hypothetical protein